jgi:hypothetical protein
VTYQRLLRWGLVAATLGLVGSPAVAHAGGPYAEASEARGSNDGSSSTAVATAPIPVDPAESERTVTTVTTVAPETVVASEVVPVQHPQQQRQVIISDPFVTRAPAHAVTWSGGTVTHGTRTSTVQVVTTTTVRSSPYAVQHHHHHHHAQPPAPPAAKPQPETKPHAVFSLPRYAAYPYASGSAGHVERVPWPTGTPAVGAGSPPGRLFSGQASTESASAGKGILRVGAHMRLAYWRLAADGNLSYYLDRRAGQAMYLGSGNVLIAPILRPRLTWWVGGGANYMMDARPNEDGRHPTLYGYNLTSSVDVFPVRPLVLSGRMDVGKLGDAPVLNARATAGLMMARFEVYGGYQLQRIGQEALRGPMFGLRVWF